MSETNPAALARRMLGEILAGRNPAPVDWISAPAGLFLTLRDPTGKVRASIGTSQSEAKGAELLEQVVRAAIGGDPRFPPLSAGELESLSLTLWELVDPRPVRGPMELRPDDAVRVQRGRLSGVFLPENYVGEAWDAAIFLRQACRRAGLEAEAHADPETRLTAFTARRHDA
ncbi:MAG: AMMECR1 domain-containing protein [Pseudomonadota bacterium]|nr:MAG: hypothetical protein DIU72_08005 [Pseudomonadota bacterium]